MGSLLGRYADVHAGNSTVHISVWTHSLKALKCVDAFIEGP